MYTQAIIVFFVILDIFLAVYIYKLQTSYNDLLKCKIKLTETNYMYQLKEQELIHEKSKLTSQISKMQNLMNKQADEIDDLMARKELNR